MKPVAKLPRDNRAFSAVAGVVLLALLYGCAVPVAPTGGPADSNPPQINNIEPAAGSINVATDRIVIEFNEYVDQASFQRAFEITPELLTPVTFSWNKKRVTISLKDTLRSNTTYIITLDSSLRDRNNVSLSRPEIAAFSTGPTINKAALRGQVLHGETGVPASGLEVHAFIMADSLAFPTKPIEPTKPDYRTQTTKDGMFSFSYLTEELFYVISFEDTNKNKLLDAGEGSGSSQQGQHLARNSEDSLAATSTILVAVADTVAPTIRRATSVSNSRVVLRFSEGIDMSRPLEIQLEDSLGTIRQPQWTYRVSSDGTEIGVLLEPLRGPQTVHVAASDSSSNADTSSTTVRMLAIPDTFRVSVEQFFSLHGRDSTDNVNRFLDDGTFGFISSGLQPIDSIRNHIMVSSADSSTEFAFSLRSANGRAIFIDPDPGVSFSDTVVVSVDRKMLHPGDSVNTATFVRFSDTELGELSGVIQWPDSSSSIVVILKSKSRSLRDVRQTVAHATDGGRFIFERLGVGTYGIDAFVDTNRNEQWDIGSIYPFLPYEPITWIPDTLRVRPRWESVIADTIRFEVGNETSPVK